MSDPKVMGEGPPVQDNCAGPVLKILLYNGTLQNGHWNRNGGPVDFGYVCRPAVLRSRPNLILREVWNHPYPVGHEHFGAGPYWELAFESHEGAAPPLQPVHVEQFTGAFPGARGAGPPAHSLPNRPIRLAPQIHAGSYELGLLNAADMLTAERWFGFRPPNSAVEFWVTDEPDLPLIQAGARHLLRRVPAHQNPPAVNLVHVMW